MYTLIRNFEEGNPLFQKKIIFLFFGLQNITRRINK